jgi:hypothetical protein
MTIIINMVFIKKVMQTHSKNIIIINAIAKNYNNYRIEPFAVIFKR